MNIPESALDAAAAAMSAYEEAPDTREVALAALEAAAPFLMAQAWDEALDETVGCCMFISDVEEHKAGNPYRSGVS